MSKLEEEIDDEMFKDHFSSCGTVTSARVMRDKDDVSLRYGYVCFSTPDEALQAVGKLNRKPIITNLLHVALYQTKEDRQYSSCHKVATCRGPCYSSGVDTGHLHNQQCLSST